MDTHQNINPVTQQPLEEDTLQISLPQLEPSREVFSSDQTEPTFSEELEIEPPAGAQEGALEGTLEGAQEGTLEAALEGTLEGAPEEASEDILQSDDSSILNIALFESGDSVQLISLDTSHSYHNKIVDFLYVEQNKIFLFDNETDDFLELDIVSNKIDTNEYKIHTLKKITETENINLDMVVSQTLDNIQVIQSGIEIQERLLTVWERKWSDVEYINSIIDTLRVLYTHKKFYDLETISKDLFELIHDVERNTTPVDTDVFSNTDNVAFIKDIIHNKYTHNFIKPIVIDKRKLYVSSEDDIINNDGMIVDYKSELLAQDSINKRSLLHRNNTAFSENKYALNQDQYEKELVNGTGNTVDLSEEDSIPVVKVGGMLKPNISPNTPEIPYEDIMRPYINTAEDHQTEHSNFEYYLMPDGLEYSSKVYRPNISHSSFIVNKDKEDTIIESNDIESRIADSNYYRYRDILDTRRITDSFGRIKSTQICHGIKGEYMYSGSFNRKEHKNSAFNKSITRVPYKYKYIDGETLLICGFMIHNVELYFPSFIEKKQYTDKQAGYKINYETYDDGYSIYDYVLQNNHTTDTLDNLYHIIYDINANNYAYDLKSIQNIDYNRNNFIYFNKNKKYSTQAMIDNERYTIHIQEQQVTIKNQSTNEKKKTTLDDTTIHKNIIDALLLHKLIYIDTNGVRRPLYNKIREQEYIQSIKQIVPSIHSVFEYEMNQDREHKHTLQKSYNIRDINKVLVPYKLTYNKLPIDLRKQLQQIIYKNVLAFKRSINKNNTTKQTEQKNKKYVHKILKKLEQITFTYLKYNGTSISDESEQVFKNYYIRFFTRFEDTELDIFLAHISPTTDSTATLSSEDVVQKIVDIIYSKYNLFYYKNLFFNDVSVSSYQQFCIEREEQKKRAISLETKAQLPPTHYCSVKSLQFLKEFYTYNSLSLYNIYEKNVSIQLAHSQLQVMEFLSLSKKDSRYELLFDIYKNIQIERELLNIETLVENFYAKDEDVFVSIEDNVERKKRAFMRLREKFNDEIRKFTYYSACYGFKIVKVYKNKYDLLKDNINDQVYYDKIFDTTDEDVDIVNEYMREQSLQPSAIQYTQQIEDIYRLFKKYYIFSPEYEIKNIAHNAIHNIQNTDYIPKKKSSGKIIINNDTSCTNEPVTWMGEQYRLSPDGTMKSDTQEFNINDLSEKQITLPSGFEIDTYNLFNYLDSLNRIVIDKDVKRKVIDGEFCILQDKRSRYIYKRLGNSWTPLSEEEVLQKGTCMLDKYHFKNHASDAVSLLDFDDLLQLESQDIIDYDLSLIDDTVTGTDEPDSSEPSSLSEVTEGESGSSTLAELDEGGQPIDYVEDIDRDFFDLSEKEPEAEAAEKPATSSSQRESLVSIGESIDPSIIMSTPQSEETVTPASNCININSLPITIKELFNNEIFHKEDGYSNVHEYTNGVMIPKPFIKFIFDINKEFNQIKEQDHIVYDKEELLQLLESNSKYIENKLDIIKKNHEERSKILSFGHNKPYVHKKKRVPYQLQQEFNDIFSIQDMDLSLTALKDFIEKYGIYYKSDECIQETKELLPEAEESLPEAEEPPQESIETTRIRQDKQIDPETDPNTSKFVYWDPYFFPNVCQQMCCKHYVDLTELAWLDNDTRNKKSKEIVDNYRIPDHTEGEALICKYCGETLEYIKYSTQEGFSSDDRPIYFREVIEEDEYTFEEDILSERSLNEKKNFKEIYNTLSKLLNVTLTKKDLHFVTTNSYTMYSMYQKSQKEIYLLYSRRYNKRIDTKLLQNIYLFYDKIIQENQNIINIFNKKAREKNAPVFMKKFYKQVSSTRYEKNSDYKQFMDYSSYLLQQRNIHNQTMEICIVMIYFILIVFYSEQRYNIVSSGDARYTGQRVIIYETLEQIKDKCIEISLQSKNTATKKSIWYNFINTEKIFNIEYLPEIKQSQQSASSYYNDTIETILLEHYFNDLYVKIHRQSFIQELKKEKEIYDNAVLVREQRISTQLQWTTFRPFMTPDYNYRNDTSLATLQTLQNSLTTSTQNKKIYTLMTSISEEIRKLSLEYISRINKYIILYKPLKHTNYVSYQSSSCYFNIQNNYQNDLPPEIHTIYTAIQNLNIASYQQSNDYYLLDTYRGLNEQEKGRYILEYFYTKEKLYQNYKHRQESDESYDTSKDDDYKQYLINKIMNINMYIVTEEFDIEKNGSVRNFVTVTDPDYYLLSTLKESDVLRDALEQKLRDKYNSVQSEYFISVDMVNEEAYDLFIQNKLDIIIHEEGETQLDTVTNMYIYTIKERIQSIVSNKTCDKLKEEVDILYNNLSKLEDRKIYINIDDSQHSKRFKQSRYKQDQQYALLRKSKTIEDLLEQIFSDSLSSISFTEELANIQKQDDKDIENSTLELFEREAINKSKRIKSYVHDFIDEYSYLNGFNTLIHDDSLQLKDVIDSFLLKQIGNKHLLEEYIDILKINLIVQGYIPKSKQYHTEYTFRKRTIQTNLRLNTIRLYNTLSTFIIIELNKLYYLIQNKGTLPSYVDTETQPIKSTSKTITFENMYNQFDQVYANEFNDESFFIIENTEKLLELIHMMDTIRNTYSIHNKLVDKKVLDINIIENVSKYIFIHILQLTCDMIPIKMKPFVKYILFTIFDTQLQINSTDTVIVDTIHTRHQELSNERKEKFDSLENDMKHLHNLYRNVNMGGNFSKRNKEEVIEENKGEMIEDDTILTVATVEDIEAQEQVQADMDVRIEYSMTNVGGEDENDEIE